MNKKATSVNISSKAARVLSDPHASATAKSLAGSSLSQRSSSRKTGAALEDLASRVLDSSKYSAETKSLAGSVLSQSEKSR